MPWLRPGRRRTQHPDPCSPGAPFAQAWPPAPSPPRSNPAGDALDQAGSQRAPLTVGISGLSGDAWPKPLPAPAGSPPASASRPTDLVGRRHRHGDLGVVPCAGRLRCQPLAAAGGSSPPKSCLAGAAVAQATAGGSWPAPCCSGTAATPSHRPPASLSRESAMLDRFENAYAREKAHPPPVMATNWKLARPDRRPTATVTVLHRASIRHPDTLLNGAPPHRRQRRPGPHRPDGLWDVDHRIKVVVPTSNPRRCWPASAGISTWSRDMARLVCRTDSPVRRGLAAGLPSTAQVERFPWRRLQHRRDALRRAAPHRDSATKFRAAFETLQGHPPLDLRASSAPERVSEPPTFWHPTSIPC